MKTIINKDNVLAEIKQGLIESCIHDNAIDEILKELENKSLNVQLTFYYRMAGFDQETISELLNLNQSTISRILDFNLQKVKEILFFYA